MNNVTLDSTNFSEQLGIYDFFNVLVSGAIFTFGLSAVNEKIYTTLWTNVTVPQGIGLVFLIYVIGLILQELGYHIDKIWCNIYSGMNQSILYGETSDGEIIKYNDVVDSSVLLKLYRRHADVLTKGLETKFGDELYNSKDVCRYVYSVCQYYVVINGKDKKIDKMRALYDMSMSLMTCFILLAIFAVFSMPFGVPVLISISKTLGFGQNGCMCCTDKLLWAIMFILAAIVFYYRARKNMRHFLLILLGTYDAIVRAEENNEIAKHDIVVKRDSL